jgi:hypothetical protein
MQSASLLHVIGPHWWSERQSTEPGQGTGDGVPQTPCPSHVAAGVSVALVLPGAFRHTGAPQVTFDGASRQRP